jgi:AraC family transcriptional regulator
MARVPAKRWETREDVLKLIETVRDQMEREPTRYALTELAEMAALSPHHFHRIFRQTYGETPLAYLNRCRLRLAHRLLSESGMTASEVCVEVGFASPASFSRKFKEAFGYPPSQTPKRDSQDSTSMASSPDGN